MYFHPQPCTWMYLNIKLPVPFLSSLSLSMPSLQPHVPGSLHHHLIFMAPIPSYPFLLYSITHHTVSLPNMPSFSECVLTSDGSIYHTFEVLCIVVNTVLGIFAGLKAWRVWEGSRFQASRSLNRKLFFLERSCHNTHREYGDWFLWKNVKEPDAGKDWRQEKGMIEDELVGWHCWLNGHEFEQTPVVGDGQGSLVCCSPWGHKESDTTELLNWTDNSEFLCMCAFLSIYTWEFLCVQSLHWYS